MNKGTPVAIYMGMVPELPVAMLACTRLGAPHTVVFGGFSADSLSGRMNDMGCEVLVTQDEAAAAGARRQTATQRRSRRSTRRGPRPSCRASREARLCPPGARTSSRCRRARGRPTTRGWSRWARRSSSMRACPSRRAPAAPAATIRRAPFRARTDRPPASRWGADRGTSRADRPRRCSTCGTRRRSISSRTTRTRRPSRGAASSGTDAPTRSPRSCGSRCSTPMK